MTSKGRSQYSVELLLGEPALRFALRTSNGRSGSHRDPRPHRPIPRSTRSAWRIPTTDDDGHLLESCRRQNEQRRILGFGSARQRQPQHPGHRRSGDRQLIELGDRSPRPRQLVARTRALDRSCCGMIRVPLYYSVEFWIAYWTSSAGRRNSPNTKPRGISTCGSTSKRKKPCAP